MSFFSSKIASNELLLKIIIVIVVFLSTFLTYKLLQKPVVYNATLKHVTHTYSRDTVIRNVVWKVDQPYFYMDKKNTNHWDAASYFRIKEKYYGADDRDYGFFPLFPFIWKFSGINIRYIGLFNYLLFGISVILLARLFLKDTINGIERLCVFAVSLTLPPVVVFYMPYAEALFTFTFVLGVYGLLKNKYWLFFISILLFAITRPVFVIAGLSFVIADLYYFMKHKNVAHFMKELSLKLSPLLLGTGIVFFMFYQNSGSFTKYFESINKHWNTGFAIPTQITDWSTEGYGMNLFSIMIIIIPSLILFALHFLKYIRSDKTGDLPGICTGNADFIKDYFFNNSIVYFWGVFLFILFFQAGSLNGISRYIIASPFFYIFLFYFYSNLKEFKMSRILVVTGILLTGCFILLTNQPELEPAVNFNDSGLFTLALSFIYLLSLRFMNDLLKAGSLLIIAFYNIVWITYLYNIYLCDGWIFT